MGANTVNYLNDVLEKPAGAMRLVAFKSALAYGHFSRGRLYQLIRLGKIAAYKDGRKTMVDLNSVDDYQRKLPRLIMRSTP